MEHLVNLLPLGAALLGAAIALRRRAKTPVRIPVPVREESRRKRERPR